MCRQGASGTVTSASGTAATSTTLRRWDDNDSESVFSHRAVTDAPSTLSHATVSVNAQWVSSMRGQQRASKVGPVSLRSDATQLSSQSRSRPRSAAAHRRSPHVPTSQATPCTIHTFGTETPSGYPVDSGCGEWGEVDRLLFAHRSPLFSESYCINGTHLMSPMGMGRGGEVTGRVGTGSDAFLSKLASGAVSTLAAKVERIPALKRLRTPVAGRGRITRPQSLSASVAMMRLGQHDRVEPSCDLAMTARTSVVGSLTAIPLPASTTVTAPAPAGSGAMGARRDRDVTITAPQLRRPLRSAASSSGRSVPGRTVQQCVAVGAQQLPSIGVAPSLMSPIRSVRSVRASN